MFGRGVLRFVEDDEAVVEGATAHIGERRDLDDKFNVSDTYVLDTFDRYVKMDRLPLTDIISIDEVFLELDEHCKYALVIQDFYTGNPIDLLSSRRTNSTEPYFMNIPLSERANAKYLISDMYNPYIQWVGKYFPNAVANSGKSTHGFRF